MSKSLLEVRELTKQYKTHLALNNVSFSIGKGNIVGLLGPNGAGKTSLLRIITGIIALDSGTVRWEGMPLSDTIISSMGYLPEERGLYKKMKVREYLLYLAQLRSIPKSNALEDIHDWLRKLSLDGWATKEIRSLSKGMQQKVQFIAAVLHQPELLILDEPLSGFDPINEKVIIDQIQSLKEKGTTILLSTHRMDSVEELCDDVVFLNEGKIVFEGSIQSLKAAYQTEKFLIKCSTQQEQLGTFLVEEHAHEFVYLVPSLDYLPNEQEVISITKDTMGMKQIFISKTQHAIS